MEQNFISWIITNIFICGMYFPINPTLGTNDFYTDINKNGDIELAIYLAIAVFMNFGFNKIIIGMI